MPELCDSSNSDSDSESPTPAKTPVPTVTPEKKHRQREEKTKKTSWVWELVDGPFEAPAEPKKGRPITVVQGEPTKYWICKLHDYPGKKRVVH